MINLTRFDLQKLVPRVHYIILDAFKKNEWCFFFFLTSTLMLQRGKKLMCETSYKVSRHALTLHLSFINIASEPAAHSLLLL